MQELLCGSNFDEQSKEIQDNLTELLVRINKIREAYAVPMKVTSGLRSMEDHLRIYAAKGITDQSKIPMKSNHLKGAAVDIATPDGKLHEWCLANVSILEEVGLWCEDFSTTKNWTHFSIFPPKSGKRFFMP